MRLWWRLWKEHDTKFKRKRRSNSHPKNRWTSTHSQRTTPRIKSTGFSTRQKKRKANSSDNDRTRADYFGWRRCLWICGTMIAIRLTLCKIKHFIYGLNLMKLNSCYLPVWFWLIFCSFFWAILRNSLSFCFAHRAIVVNLSQAIPKLFFTLGHRATALFWTQKLSSYTFSSELPLDLLIHAGHFERNWL